MHCPQCGQPFSDEVSFCKSCGLSLEGTKELFAPADKQRTAFKDWVKRRRRSRGRRGVYRGMIAVAVGIVFLLFLGEPSIVYPLIILTAGLFRIFFAMAFQEVISTKAEYSGSMFDESRTPPSLSVPTSLPPAHSIPVSEYYPAQVNTAEITVPASVTENTTNLLTRPDEPQS